jgi:DNA-directed RNA polymerase specialized sigma24 family protein
VASADRAQRWDRRRSSGAPIPLVPDLADTRRSSSPEAAAIDRERHAALVGAVARSPDAQRDALALRYAAGLTAVRIGEVLTPSASTRRGERRS